MPPQLFSRTAKNQDKAVQTLLAEDMSSDTFLENADLLRKQGNSRWLGSALVNTASNNLKVLLGKGFRNKLRTIGDEFQREFDPKKSWKDYIKKALKIQLEEADIGIYSTLQQIAKARGLNVITGSDAYSTLEKLNISRSEITDLLSNLKESGISDSEISKYILPALVGSYKMGNFKLNDNRKAPNLFLTDKDVFIDEGTTRQGIYGSSTDAKANANIESTEKISGQIHKHKTWYIKPLSKDQQKKYGVKNFDDLPLNKRAEFIKNEIQPEGLRAKEILELVTVKMVEMVANNELSSQTAAVFIDLQFARMDGLGKLASDIKFIPFNTRKDLTSIFNLPINDEFVLEHTIPGNRIKLAMFNAVIGNDKASMNLFKSELEQYHSAIIPDTFDSLVNRKDGKELFLRTTPAIRRAGDFALSETGRYADNSRFPMSLVDVNDNKVYGQPQQLEATVEESRVSNNEEALKSKVQTPANKGKQFSKTNEDILNDFSKMDQSIRFS